MKQFRFRLDPVLAHRERAEREQSAEHARALAAQLVAERARDDLVRLRDASRTMLVHEHNRLDAETLRATYVHLEYLDRAISAAQRRADECATERERERARLVEAARDRKVLATLRERRREAHLLDAAMAEQRELDDQNGRLRSRAHSLEGRPS